MSSNLGLWHNATQTSGQIHRSAEARGRGEGAGRGAGRRCRQFRFWIRRPTARWRRSRSGLEARDVGLGLGRKEEEEGPMGRPQPMAAEEAASVSDLCVCVWGRRRRWRLLVVLLVRLEINHGVQLLGRVPVRTRYERTSQSVGPLVLGLGYLKLG